MEATKIIFLPTQKKMKKEAEIGKIRKKTCFNLNKLNSNIFLSQFYLQIISQKNKKILLARKISRKKRTILLAQIKIFPKKRTILQARIKISAKN